MSKIQAKTDDEARQLLLWHGVQHFRVQGGFIAGNAPIELCGLCDCQWRVRTKYVFGYGGVIRAYPYCDPGDEQDLLGEVVLLAGSASCCFECAYKVNTAIDRDDIYITSSLVDDYCQLCGRYCDGIPF